MIRQKRVTAEMERMLTVSEAAEILGVSKTTIRKLSKIGQIKSFRIGTGKHRRFKKKDLIEYLERNS